MRCNTLPGTISGAIITNMPQLKNLKRETFCRKILEGTKLGISQAEAYEQSGYRTTGHASEVAASRLLSMVEVQRRLEELSAPTVRKTRATIDTLAEQFDAVFDGAMGSAQFGAAGSAAAAKSKLLGFMRDRLEVGGPGDFAACETIEEAVAMLLADMSPAEALEQVELTRQAIEHYAGDHAEVIVPEMARKPSTEVGDALALFQPTRKTRRN